MKKFMIKRYTFDWLDKRDNKMYHRVKYGEYGEIWEKGFEEHPELCELKNKKVEKVEIKKGMEFISPDFDGWVLVVEGFEYNISLGTVDVWVADKEINGVGECKGHYSPEQFERKLDWFEYVDSKEVA